MARIRMNIKQKRILAVIIAVLIALSLFVVFSQSLQSKDVDSSVTRIACLGDSITNMTDYPADLHALLGSKSTVGDFGYDGAAVNFYAERTYLGSEPYRNARAFKPTTVVMILGTNDARTYPYLQIDRFLGDYKRLIQRIENFSGKPKIFLALPPAVFENTLNISISTFTQEIIPRIQQVASDLNLPVIDVYSPLANHPEYFTDGVHPNAEGAQIIANTIYKAITSDPN
jgi:lysophospholipase L1-like esterase